MERIYSSLFGTKKIYYTHWDLKASACGRDLVVKKISIAIIGIANFAALGGLLYYIVSYTTIPTQALFVSPFIVGALAALSYLNVPTFGINSSNYSTYVNPVYMLGRVGAYIFFGPLVYAVQRIDLTAYHDRIVANQISDDLDSLPFDELVEKYGRHIDNLIHYGFIHKQYEQKIKALYREYLYAKSALEFWNKSGLKGDGLQRAQERIQTLKEEWVALKESFLYDFPHPEEPSFDFSKKATWINLFIREYFVVGTPFDGIRFQT